MNYFERCKTRIENAKIIDLMHDRFRMNGDAITTIINSYKVDFDLTIHEEAVYFNDIQIPMPIEEIKILYRMVKIVYPSKLSKSVLEKLKDL